MPAPKLDARTLAGQITMHVKLRGEKSWKVCVWIARQLITLAAWVMGVGIEIEEMD